jgi:hypothetical protein
VIIPGDFEQCFVYYTKDDQFGSLRHNIVELEKSKQRIEQDRVELRALHIEEPRLELRADGIDEMKQTHKPFSFRKAILRQDRQDDQERAAQAQERFSQAQERYAQAQEKLVQDRESS